MPSSSSVLKYEPDGRKLVITLNRPDAMNALNAELCEAIGDAMEAYAADDDLLVAIVTGEGGRAFSAGGDLTEAAQVGGGQFRETGLRLFDRIDACPKPLIAAVDGYCLAGGLEATLYCDIVVATEASRFGLPEPRHSMMPGPGLHLLPKRIPYREALLLQLTGGHMTAQRAYEIGLVQRLVTDRTLMWAAAHQLADEIMLCAPLVVRAIKRIAKEGQGLVPAEWEQLVEPLRERIGASEDRSEARRAFAEKRPPRWRTH